MSRVIEEKEKEDTICINQIGHDYIIILTTASSKYKLSHVVGGMNFIWLNLDGCRGQFNAIFYDTITEAVKDVIDKWKVHAFKTFDKFIEFYKLKKI